MNIASPLRYPGGKSSMAGLLRQIRGLNGLGNRAIAEPFAGGAGASLTLLYREETHEIYINDADPSIYDFWWAVVNKSQPFMTLLKKTRVNIAEWYRQREVFKERKHISQVRRGFSTFFLNRCNRSGVIKNGGPIGGTEQAGEWKLDARFNKSTLQSRCKKIAEYRERIHVSCRDGLDFIKMIGINSTFFFIDPPYYVKGNTLYLNTLDKEYHVSLAEQLRAMADAAWVLTYDDCPEIRRMYQNWANIRPFSLRYTAAKRRSGKELLITPKWMRLPEHQASAAINW